MKCSKCGKDLHPGAKFCSRCGAEVTYIGKASQAAAAKAAAEEPAPAAEATAAEAPVAETAAAEAPVAEEPAKEAPVVTTPAHVPGEEFELGTYNGAKLTWIMLKIQDGMALSICKDSVGFRTYHTSQSDVTWSTCALRAWLNNDFARDAFAPSEKNKILPCNVINTDNPQSKTPGGEPTTDKVFLLSIAEAEFLFENDKARDIGKYWWLRSPGSYPNYAACVSKHGHIEPKGYYVYGNSLCEDISVRPAMWIQL